MNNKYVSSEPRYEDMQEWLAYLRKHHANIFDVYFKDLENITDEDFVIVIGEIATFWGIPTPVLRDKCSAILEIATAEDAVECELFYNLQLMKKSGINNLDTLRLSLVHEISHQLLFCIRFMLFENELWIQELAADMMVGAFSIISGDVATGKYKYVLRQLPASMTHPDGTLRAAIVEYGREYIAQLRKQKKVSDIQEVLKGLPAFVYEHYQKLHESWVNVQWDDEKEDTHGETSPINYESLPDTNLLKQYYLKHKERKEDET
jgi:hypothetical protein